MFTIRLAVINDVPVLQQLIATSVRGLSNGYYSDKQIESSIKYIFGIDTQLLIDGTYYVIEEKDAIVGCGGWSKRRTLYGGDQHKHIVDPVLDPKTDAARIRAFFVDPTWARRGIGKMLIQYCETEAIKNGFAAMELGATLPGEPLYLAMGYKSISNIIVDMPDGEKLAVVKMRKALIAK
jgi:N-acetylglutamate synthase-like GNAT family acetyltransferase